MWLVTVTNDCFFFLMKAGQPVLAFLVLKIAESYFSYKNESTDFFLLQNTGVHENDDEICLQMEINQFLLNSDSAYDAVAQSLRDPEG